MAPVGLVRVRPLQGDDGQRVQAPAAVDRTAPETHDGGGRPDDVARRVEEPVGVALDGGAEEERQHEDAAEAVGNERDVAVEEVLLPEQSAAAGARPNGRSDRSRRSLGDRRGAYRRRGRARGCIVFGREYGEDWHQAGKLRTKPNTIADFVACAQHLVERKITSQAVESAKAQPHHRFMIGRHAWVWALLGAVACSGGSATAAGSAKGLPLVPVADVELPGKATRFDYEDIDAARGHLIIAHMNDASVVVANLSDGSVVKVLPNIPVARGVIVGGEVGRIFVTSSPSTLVIVDATSLNEIARVGTGNKPDGVGWDPVHQVVGVSDQGDGAVSLIAGAGSGQRVQVPLGRETGNVVFDPSRGLFWASVVTASPPDQLAAVDPVTHKVTTRIDLPGCRGAHGLRLHPDGKSAFVACEDNDTLARVDLGGAHAVVTAKTGKGPDVLSIDPGLGFLYVAAESGNLTVFDINQPGLVSIDSEHPGDNAHSVAVDPATHRVFFPLMAGPNGKPVLRIMRPSSTK